MRKTGLILTAIVLAVSITLCGMIFTRGITVARYDLPEPMSSILTVARYDLPEPMTVRLATMYDLPEPMTVARHKFA